MARLLPSLVTLLVLGGFAPSAFARPSFPAELDRLCRNQGRTPENPATIAVESDGPGADCALCHDFSPGVFPSGGNVNADGRAFRQGNLDPFCTLVAANQPPVLESIGNQTVDVGALLSFTVRASDPDGDSLVLSVSPLPTGASFVETAPGEALFAWEPTLDQAGLNTLRFSASDGMASDFEDVVVTVGDVNAPPTLASIGNQQVEVGLTLELMLSASDPEMGVLTYTFEGLPADATATDLGDGSATIVWSPAAPAVASVTVTVTDDGVPAESDSETFSLRAVDPGAAGDLAIRKAQWKDEAEKLKLKGSGAEPGQTIQVYDAESDALLATKRLDDDDDEDWRDGHFSLCARPFLAPCSVTIAADDGPKTPATMVERAPADCGERLLTRVKKAKWHCRKGELRVKGDRGPLDGMVQIRATDTQALLDEVPTDDKGRFRSSVTLSEKPVEITVTILSAGSEWSLPPVPVRASGGSCNGDGGKPPKDRPGKGDDDEDDDHGSGNDDDHGSGNDDDHGPGNYDDDDDHGPGNDDEDDDDHGPGNDDDEDDDEDDDRGRDDDDREDDRNDD